MTAQSERAAIIEYLRMKSDAVFDLGYPDNARQLDEAADAIERGAHLQERSNAK